MYFNTAVVMDADSAILGKYRKPRSQLPLWEEGLLTRRLGFPSSPPVTGIPEFRSAGTISFPRIPILAEGRQDLPPRRRAEVPPKWGGHPAMPHERVISRVNRGKGSQTNFYGKVLRHSEGLSDQPAAMSAAFIDCDRTDPEVWFSGPAAEISENIADEKK
jgi:hypothetical protein